jgi:hypothetical protein
MLRAPDFPEQFAVRDGPVSVNGKIKEQVKFL